MTFYQFFYSEILDHNLVNCKIWLLRIHICVLKFQIPLYIFLNLFLYQSEEKYLSLKIAFKNKKKTFLYDFQRRKEEHLLRLKNVYCLLQSGA